MKRPLANTVIDSEENPIVYLDVSVGDEKGENN